MSDSSPQMPSDSGSKLLIVDPDEGFKRRLTLKSVVGTIIYFFESALKAKPLLSDPSIKLDGIFVSQDLPRRDWLETVQLANQSRPEAAIFNIMSNGNCWRITDEEIQKYKVQKSLKKETTHLRELMEAVETFGSDFDKQEAMKHHRKDELVGHDVKGQEANFFPIEIELFFSGAQCIFDVYIHLKKNQKFLKILNAMDRFDPALIEDLRKSGLAYLYIRQEAAQSFVKYTNHVSKRALNSERVSINVKEFLVMSQGQQTLKYIRRNLSEDSLRFAHQFAARTKTVVDQLKKLGPEKFPEGFFGNLAQYEHCVATVLLA